MPKVKIENTFQKPVAVAFEKIKEFFNNDKDLKSFDSNMTCEFDEKNCTGRVNGKQFKANINVAAQSDSESRVVIEIDLPLLLSPFKGKIKDTVEKKLEKAMS